MSFSPSSPLAMSHKQYRGLESQVVVQTTINEPLGVVPVATVTASWLAVSMSSIVDAKTFRWLFKLKSAADNLPAGSYSTTVTFKHQYQVGQDVFDVTETFAVELTVTETLKLSASRSQFNIIYFEGQNPPAAEYFNLVTENAWTATPDQSWIQLDRLSGNGSTQLQLTADVTGLAVGEYSGQILFQDGYDQLLLNVALSVRGEDTASDFLLISPQTITFAEVQGQPPASSKAITVQSSQDFTLSVNVAWLQLSSANETAGTKTVTLSVINTQALASGNYSGMVTIASSFSSKTISVGLLINDAAIEGIDLNAFYFAADRDRITLLSTQPNTELVLDFEVQGQSKIHNFSKRVPFFQGKASALIADFADNTVEHLDFFANTKSRVFVPVYPLSVGIDAYNKDLYSSQQTLRESYQGIQALTGSTPATADKLSMIPQTVYASPDAFVGFSFRADQKPDLITFTGSSSGTRSVGSLIGPIYTCFVNLSELILSAGDVLNIFCGKFSLKVNIVDREPETTHLAWLNQWNCPEFYSCRGYLTEIREASKTTARFADQGKEITRVLEVRRPRDYTLNTGFLFSQEEYEWLATILDARKVWIYRDGQWKEVVCETRTLQVYKTREFFTSYKLSFTSAVI